MQRIRDSPEQTCEMLVAVGLGIIFWKKKDSIEAMNNNNT